MKDSKAEPLTLLDPNHPNYDAILLKRFRLEAHRRRRLENSGALAAPDKAPAGRKGGKRSRPHSGA